MNETERVLPFSADNCSNPQRRCNDDISGVKISIKFQGFSHDSYPNTEKIIGVAMKHRFEIAYRSNEKIFKAPLNSQKGRSITAYVYICSQSAGKIQQIIKRIQRLVFCMRYG